MFPQFKTQPEFSNKRKNESKESIARRSKLETKLRKAKKEKKRRKGELQNESRRVWISAYKRGRDGVADGETRSQKPWLEGWGSRSRALGSGTESEGHAKRSWFRPLWPHSPTLAASNTASPSPISPSLTPPFHSQFLPQPPTHTNNASNPNHTSLLLLLLLPQSNPILFYSTSLERENQVRSGERMKTTIWVNPPSTHHK